MKRLILAILVFIRSSEAMSSIKQLSSNENVHYTLFSPNKSGFIEFVNLIESSIQIAVHHDHCSGIAFQDTWFQSTTKSIVICGNENVTMFNRTVEQVAAATDQLQGKWAPCYFLIWPDNLEKAEAAEESMKRISTEYGSSFQVNSDVYVLFAVSHTSGPLTFHLWEFYGIGNEDVYREIHLPTNLTANANNFKGKLNRRSNFHNLTIRATAERFEDFDLDVKFKNGSDPLEFESGMNVDTLQFLANSLNFSIKAFVGTWVQNTGNDSKTKHIRDQLIDGDVDICITEFYVTLRRSEYLKFLHSTYTENLKAYFSKPAASDFRDIFLVAFQWDVWGAVALICLVLVVILKLFLWITMCFISGEEVGDGSVNSALYSESYLFVVGVATQQGWHIQPESKSIRVIFLVGYLTGLVCFVAYSAAIVSTLSINRDYVTSFGNLIHKNYQMMADYDVHPIEFVKDKLEFNNRLPENMPSSQAVNRMVTSKSALVSHADEVYPALRNRKLENSVFYTDHVICDQIRYINVGRSLTMYAMMLKKGSYLADFFNSRLLRERECGVLHRLLVRHVRTGRVSCNSEDINVRHALGLEDVFTVYVILLLGYLSSFMAFAIEMLWNSKVLQGWASLGNCITKNV